jgi:hypothetical protein
MDFDNFLFLKIFSFLFDFPPDSFKKSADLLPHSSVPRHTGWKLLL